MSYNIIWDKKATNFLYKIDYILAQRIIKYIKEFAQEPRKKQFKKLKGKDGFRLRVGEYRIILEINYTNKSIQILKIGHRKNIYER